MMNSSLCLKLIYLKLFEITSIGLSCNELWRAESQFLESKKEDMRFEEKILSAVSCPLAIIVVVHTGRWPPFFLLQKTSSFFSYPQDLQQQPYEFILSFFIF